MGDKGYSSKRCRAALRRRGIKGLIPARANERSARQKKGRKGGRPYRFEKALYRARNVVERCILRLKQFRRVATRYDKCGRVYQGFVTLAAIMVWLKGTLSDTL
jgi:transposase